MPEGTPIFAARAGVVIDVRQENKFSKFAPGLCPKPVQMECKAPLSEANRISVF